MWLLYSSPIGPQPYSVIDVVANPVRGHKEVPRSTGHTMVTTRYSNQQGSKSRQKVMQLYKRWHRPITKRFIKPPLTPYREQPRSTRIVVAYPRPAFSATNRTNTFQPVLISLIADGPHHYHPACGHKGSSHLSLVHALQFVYRDASSAVLQLVNQWLNFTYSRSHAFGYERKNTNPTLVRIELTTSALAGVQITY